MRYILTTFLCVQVLISTYAQSPRFSDVAFVTAPSYSAKSENGGEPDKKLRANSAQARKKIVGLFNLFKDYEVIVDTAAMRTAFTDLMKDEPTVAATIQNTEMNAADFTSYLDKTQKLLASKLEKMEKETIRTESFWQEKNRVQRALSILQSAYCLAGKERAGSFVFSKDVDGYDIICFPLDSLRSNPRYGAVDNYKEGFARIRKDQVYGYLNYCGDEFITCQYQVADAFNYGKALVKKVDWYFLDIKGEESNTLENITDAKALTRGISLAKFTNGKYALIDNNFDVTQTPISEYYDAIEPFYRKEIFKVRTGKKVGLINIDGSVKLDINYDKIEPSKQLAKVFVLRLEEGMGLLDSLGNVKFKPTFISIGDFNKYGLAIATSKESVQLINGKTMEASKPYDNITAFNRFGLANIRNKEKQVGLIDSTMKVVLQPSYTDIGKFNKYGLASASKSATQWGFINPTGTEVIPTKYAAVGEFNAYGMVAVREANPTCNKGECLIDAVLDAKGKTIIAASTEASFANTRYFVTDTLISNRYVALVQTTNSTSGYRLIDKKDNKVINKFPYDAIAPHDQYFLFAFRDDAKWGLMDTTGRVVAKPIYKEIRKPKEEYYPALNDKGKWGYIDKRGKPQIPFEYDDVKSFRASYAIVSQGKDKWGLINRFNAKVVPCAFKSVTVITTSDKYEIVDTKDNVFIVNEKGDCERNCEVFENVRRAANAGEMEVKK